MTQSSVETALFQFNSGQNKPDTESNKAQVRYLCSFLQFLTEIAFWQYSGDNLA